MGPSFLSEPGVKTRGPLLATMRRDVANLLGRQNISFPGAQPVSFLRKHIEALMQDDYFLCEKSDGIRYLLYITTNMNDKETHYLIDRKNEYWWLSNNRLHFPLPDDPQRHHTRTILDGELVVDTLPDGRQQSKFIVFDCLVMDGELLVQKPLDKRLGILRQRLMAPHKTFCKQHPQHLKLQPFTLELKTMQLGYGIEMMFREVLPALQHGNDGLIFTCKNTAYKYGTDPHILKWKPPAENTLDCRLRLHFTTVQPDADDRSAGITQPYPDYDAVPHAELWSFLGDAQYRYLADCHITEPEWEVLKGLNDPLVDRIVECYKDDLGRWRIMRFRDDKSEANHLSTVQGVLQSIDDAVTEHELSESAKAIKDNWKAREKQVMQAQKAQLPPQPPQPPHENA